MKIKLDENLGNLRIATWLRQAGYDVMTVRQQGLTSTPDENLIEICHSENRCLVTGDQDFSNRLKYNPGNYSGIVVIRLPSPSTFENWKQAIATLIEGLESADVMGKLWIIRQGKIQEYQAIETEDDYS